LERVWALTPLDFEYPAFLMIKRKRIIRMPIWMTGYLVIIAVLIVMSATVGHDRWNVWSYVVFGSISAWLAATALGLHRGWFH
jgi:hypothetical protein